MHTSRMRDCNEQGVPLGSVCVCTCGVVCSVQQHARHYDDIGDLVVMVSVVSGWCESPYRVDDMKDHRDQIILHMYVSVSVVLCNAVV